MGLRVDWEKLIYQQTQGAVDHLKTGSRTIYMGTDITAPSLHQGHLIALLLLKALKDAGHKIIIVLGGSTSLIGDPTDKDSERPAISRAQISENIDKIRECVELILGKDVTILNNSDWLDKISWIDMIVKYGRKVSVNSLIKTETFHRRLAANKPLSFLELSYPLCQAYDFVFLKEHYDCTVQVGGSDQWSNILTGVHMGECLHAITCPLLLGSNGKKISKSEGKNEWLHPSMGSAFDLWQFFRNLDDETINSMKYIETDTQDPNERKIQIATHMTSLVYGEQAMEVQRQAEEIFSKGSIDHYPEFSLPQKKYSL